MLLTPVKTQMSFDNISNPTNLETSRSNDSNPQSPRSVNKTSLFLGFNKFFGFKHLNSKNNTQDLSEMVFEQELSKEPHDAIELNVPATKGDLISKFLSVFCISALVTVFILAGLYSHYSSLSNNFNFSCNNLGKTKYCSEALRCSKLVDSLAVAIICLICVFAISLFLRTFKSKFVTVYYRS
eukprot:NODE_608_length_6066_cov_0.184347.p2 type:complete len:183 gc:universal NODE_608_length_6066_cov_0.184347:1348-1896(+)